MIKVTAFVCLTEHTDYRGSYTYSERNTMNVLVAVASKHGSTWEIAQTIGEVIADYGINVTVAQVDDFADISDYDAIVLGSAVYMGRWMRSARTFIRKHLRVLQSRPVWLFSSGPASNPHHQTNQQSVDIEGIATRTSAIEHQVFAGRIDETHINTSERLILNLVHARQGDYREWGAICAWANNIAEMLTEQKSLTRTSK